MPTWAGFWPRYIDRFSVSRHRKSTTDLHRICCRKIAEFLGDVPLDKFTDAAIDDFVAWRKRSGVSNRTVNIELAVMARAVGVAIRWGELVGLPWKRLPKLPEGPVRIRFLTPETRARLLDEAGPHRDLILFFLSTGLRRAELRDLTWADVAGDRIWVRDSKTGQARSVPLSPTAKEVLARRARIRSLREPAVFLNSNTGRRYADLSHIVKRVLRRAGLEDFHLHDLRHAFATHMHECGAELCDLMEVLGHKSPEMSKRYVHPSTQRIDGLFRKMGEELSAWEQLGLDAPKKLLTLSPPP